MLQKATYLFVFDRRKRAKETGLGLIELVINFGMRRRKWISTKIKVSPAEWNKKKREVNVRHQNHIALNIHLKSLRSEIETCELGLINSGKPFTANSVDDLLKGQKVNHTFSGFSLSMASKDNTVSPVTRRDHLRSLAILCDFKKEVRFGELDFGFIHQFDNYLNSVGFNQSTIGKVHKNVKRFINLAIKYGKMKPEENPYLNFTVRRSRPHHTWLNYRELELIERLDVSKVVEMDVVKDIFLFSCYTGLRYSDLKTLNTGSFISQQEGVGLKLQRMAKVDRPVHLKLWEMFDGKPEQMYMRMAEAAPDAEKSIWKKYISNSKMNLILKELQAAAGIKKKLTIHVGRHTFGTLYAHQTGSIFEVMRAMGISKFETAQVYVDLSAEL
ncbi:MAG: site-specific integrase [Bacteroidales bacterium]|nr:site-specific integrase [Bacteroidales bacterium]